MVLNDSVSGQQDSPVFPKHPPPQFPYTLGCIENLARGILYV